MTDPPALPCDRFITQNEAKNLAGGISDMTLWRWRKAGIIPLPMTIRGRNYWKRRDFMNALTGSGQPK